MSDAPVRDPADRIRWNSVRESAGAYYRANPLDRIATIKGRGRVGWDSIPPGIVSLSWGSAWASSARSLIPEIPSVVIPEDSNILINPRHRDAARLRSQKMRRWTYDVRLENSQPRPPSH